MYRTINPAWSTNERDKCIRANDCEWARVSRPGAPDPFWVCPKCEDVPRMRAFQQKLYRFKGASTRTNDAHLSRTDLLELKGRFSRTMDDLRTRVRQLVIGRARDRIKLRGANKKLQADMERGDVAAVTYGIRKMHRKGVFDGAAPRMIMALDALASVCAPTRGARPTAITKELACAVRAQWGPACVKFLSANMGVGSATSSATWTNAERKPFKTGIHEENFINAASTMAAAMKRLNIKGPITHQT
jgi:hypothetical protein